MQRALHVQALDRRLTNLYDTSEWEDGPDGVVMSVFQREAFEREAAKAQRTPCRSCPPLQYAVMPLCRHPL